jgi:hypothetical protein
MTTWQRYVESGLRKFVEQAGADGRAVEIALMRGCEIMELHKLHARGDAHATRMLSAFDRWDRQVELALQHGYELGCFACPGGIKPDNFGGLAVVYPADATEGVALTAAFCDQCEQLGPYRLLEILRGLLELELNLPMASLH